MINEFLRSMEDGVFLYTPEKGSSYLFRGAKKEIICKRLSEVNIALGKADAEIKKGRYCAGYISYEAGFGILPGLKKTGKDNAALLHFGVYGKPKVFTDLKLKYDDDYGLKQKFASVSLKEYNKKFNAVINALENGDAYQINLCFKMLYDFSGSPAGLFSALCRAQKVKYAAFIRLGGRIIISVSPELFFEMNGKEILMKPMKGTLLKSDKKHSVKDLKNAKGMSENVMITDMLRNDLGKVCVPGSITVPKLFSVEEYSTLYQMTSTVKGTLNKNTAFSDVIKAVFPSGSVTGAPKISSMNLINELEKDKRGVYTGAIGFTSKNKTVFNVPIRTLEIKGCRAEMGIGSGIVYDSKPASEYKECIGKAAFARNAGQNFGLIESVLLQDGKLFLPVEHLKRMWDSAKFFGFDLNQHEAEHIMKKAAYKYRSGTYKLRLLYKDGKFTSDCKKLMPLPEGTVMISRHVMNSQDVFLRHKTTLRGVYDSDYKAALKAGYADVIYLNDKGRVTEAHSSNVFIKIKGRYYTPPVSCGLLPGTLRDHLLKKQSETFKEKILYPKDLKKSKKVYLLNSVRGMREFNFK